MRSKPVRRIMNSKRRRKAKPVNKILNHCMQILPLIIIRSMGKNEIFAKLQQLKHRGLNYKFDTYDAIFHLQRGGLMHEIVFNQKQVQELTPLGRELAEMIIGSDKYKKSYSALRNAFDNKFNTPKQKNKRTLRIRLKNNGWNEDEIEWFDYYDETVSFVLSYADDYFIRGALQKRFELIIREFGSVSEIAKTIINTLILNASVYHISFVSTRHIEEDYPLSLRMPGGLPEQDGTPYIDRYVEINEEVIFDFQEASGQVYYPKLISNEVKNMLVSMLCMLKPPRELVGKYIQDLKSFRSRWADVDYNIIPSGLGREYDEGKKRRMKYELSKNENCVLSAYEEYLSKLT
jgi:hypothetical protein